jgi:hypothetical protein
MARIDYFRQLENGDLVFDYYEIIPDPYAFIKQNYVIAIQEWDEVGNPPIECDEYVQLTDKVACVGAWYEKAEGIFYQPLNTPPDFPTNYRVIS